MFWQNTGKHFSQVWFGCLCPTAAPSCSAAPGPHTLVRGAAATLGTKAAFMMREAAVANSWDVFMGCNQCDGREELPAVSSP